MSDLKEVPNFESAVRVFAYHQQLESPVAFCQAVFLVASKLKQAQDLDCVNGIFDAMGKNVGAAKFDQVAFPAQRISSFTDFVSANFNYYPGSKIIKL